MSKPEIMTNEEAKKKAMAIGMAIQANNPDWWRVINENDEWPSIRISHKDGAEAMIRWSIYPKEGDKFWGYHVVAPNQDYLATGPALKIGASMERSVEEIARTFASRLLPAVLEKWKSHQEQAQKIKDSEEAQKSILSRIHAALDREPDMGRKSIGLHNDNFYGQISATDRTVDIEIHGAPVSMALEIAAIIKKHTQIGEDA